MCTPWTMTRLVRWRVRDWASCFLPYDHEPDHPMPMRNNKMVFDTKGERSSRGNNIEASNKRKLSCQKKLISKEEANNNSNSNNNNNSNSSTPSTTTTPHEDSNWPHFADEDYIIFCFREDGAFEVVKNNGNKTDHDQLPSTCLDRNTNSSRSSRPVNRKLNYGENTKTVVFERCSNDQESLTGKLANEAYPTTYGQKVEENIYLDSDPVSGGNLEKNRVVSSESSDSTHSSDASSGSFAFPALGWEWTGSPERMPKSEGLHLRKHKARCVGFQCCRF